MADAMKRIELEKKVEKYLDENGEKLQSRLTRYGTASCSFQVLGDCPEMSEEGIGLLVEKLQELGFTVIRKTGATQDTYGANWRYVTLTISV
jgi:hypothetical protein